MSGLVTNVWRHRELLASLVRREILSRYKQSALGPAWAILQPLVLMLTFSMVDRFAHLPSDNVPYPLFTFSALLPSSSCSRSVHKLVFQFFQNLVTRSRLRAEVLKRLAV